MVSASSPGDSAANAENLYDNCAVDAYSHHLAEINKTRSVVATCDIVNAQGALLVAKGTQIDQRIVDRIVHFKLLRPIETSVAVSDEIDGKKLFQDILAAVGEDAQLQTVFTAYRTRELLVGLCQAYQSWPLLRQKLTVMAARLPSLYRRGLHCAWLGALMAHKLHWGQEAVCQMFIAGLAHDLGMLHIDQSIVGASDTLTPEQWRQMQAHVVIGQKILGALEGLDPAVARATLEHHERCDGTGYPFGRLESELSAAGKMLALVDSILAVYFNRFAPERRTLRDLIPVIQINHQAHHRDAGVLMVLLRVADNKTADNLDPGRIAELVADAEAASHCFTTLHRVLMELGFTHGDRRLHAIQNVQMHIATALHGSGLLDSSYIHWLEQLAENPGVGAKTVREVEDVALMLTEVRYHLHKLQRMMSVYVSEGQAASAELIQKVGAALEELDWLDAPGIVPDAASAAKTAG